MFSHIKNRNLFTSAMVASSFLIVATTNAETTVSGTIDASITLIEGCIVNGSSSATDVSFGSIDYGTVAAVFNEVDSQVLGDGVANGIEIKCTAGSAVTFTITAGLNDGVGASGTHAMKHVTETNYVGYTLFTDSGFSNALAIGIAHTVGTFTSETQTQTFQVWGRAFGDNGLPAGVYADTLQVLLEIN